MEAISSNKDFKLLICGSFMNQITLNSGNGTLNGTQYEFNSGSGENIHTFTISTSSLSNNYLLI